MTTQSVYGMLLATLLAGPVLALQEKPVQETTSKAAAARTAMETVYTLPVKGLSTENLAKVRDNLSALTFKQCACPECGHVQAGEGVCKMCDVTLEPCSVKIFNELRPTPDKGVIAFRLNPTAQVRMSAIESALTKSAVEIQREKLQLTETCTLVFTGGRSGEDAAGLQSALRDAKLADAEARFDAGSKEIHVHFRNASPAWSVLADTGSKLSRPLRLADIVWSTTVAPRG